MRHSPLNPPPELLAALDTVVSGLVAVRAQIHSLHAAESLLLQAGNLLANHIAAVGASSRPTDSALNMAYRTVQTEIGAALHESDRTIAVKMGRATDLIEQYPAVYSALARGTVSASHANAIVEAGGCIDEDLARSAYEVEALRFAEAESLSRLRPVTKQLAEKHSGQAREQRHQQARAMRRVFVVEREDGMADLTAHLPAPYAFGIKDRLDQLARNLLDARAQAGQRPQTSGVGAPADAVPADAASATDNRSADQLRADILADMLLASDVNHVRTTGAAAGGVSARVQVVVPAKVVARDGGGSARNVATLEGYGPISDFDAIELAANADVWEMVSVEAATGSVLKVDTYRPSAAQRRFLGARDLHCRFPGCRATLAWCDIDHTVDAALGGATSLENLGHLCRRHHTLKHASPWTVAQDQQGEYTWVSPTGRSYSDTPESNVRFRPIAESSGKTLPSTGPWSEPPPTGGPWGTDPSARRELDEIGPNPF